MSKIQSLSNTSSNTIQRHRESLGKDYIRGRNKIIKAINNITDQQKLQCAYALGVTLDSAKDDLSVLDDHQSQFMVNTTIMRDITADIMQEHGLFDNSTSTLILPADTQANPETVGVLDAYVEYLMIQLNIANRNQVFEQPQTKPLNDSYRELLSICAEGLIISQKLEHQLRSTYKETNSTNQQKAISQPRHAAGQISASLSGCCVHDEYSPNNDEHSSASEQTPIEPKCPMQ